MTTAVPFADLKAQYASIKNEIDETIRRTIESAEFIGGENVSAFENAFAQAIGVKHCIGVANGTDAIFIALRALNIGQGHEVICPANSFIASSEAITQAGARPVFVDCDPETRDLDLGLLEKALARPKNNIKAILAVHLYGRAADMTRICQLASQYKVAVLEDCAQAHLAEHAGRKVGSFGVAATFSFYPGKNLGAYGDAGAIVTNDEALAKHLRMFANHGRLSKYDHEFEGVNSRLDALQAGILGVKLRHLDAWTTKRIDLVRQYNEQLAGVSGVTTPVAAKNREHVYHLYVVRVRDRERVRAELAESGVATGVHYPIALPNLTAYRYLEHRREDFPVASQQESEILSLPLFAELSASQLSHVCETLRRVAR